MHLFKTTGSVETPNFDPSYGVCYIGPADFESKAIDMKDPPNSLSLDLKEAVRSVVFH